MSRPIGHYEYEILQQYVFLSVLKHLNVPKCSPLIFALDMYRHFYKVTKAKLENYKSFCTF